MRLNKIKFIGTVRYLLLSCVFVMGLISIIATGGGDGGGGTADTGSGTGTLSISMTDSITDELAEVWVTIKEVSYHISVDEENGGDGQDNGGNGGEDTASWEQLEGENIPGTFNLLELVNGVLQPLGTGELEAGHYTQIRLLLGGDEGDNYVVTKDNPPQELDLQISSQDETGIKLTKGFDIEEGVVTEVILDWDMEKSIMKNPQGYKLKPTIKILRVEVASTISGKVTDTEYPEGEEPPPIPGALVTAQVVDGDYASVVASTTTGEDGGYSLILEEGTYNIVVYNIGYSPECTTIELGPATDEPADFTLTSVTEEDLGTVSGVVTITDPVTDQTVDISIQQDSDCDGDGESNKIVIAYYSVSNGGDYSATLPELPEGEYYSLVASTTVDEETETQTYDVTIDYENPATQNLEF